MTVLGGLLSGEGPPVLQTCRFEGFGGELYGRAAISHRLADLQSLVSSPLLDVETARMGVWMDAEHAVVGDLVHGKVQRLWLLSDRVGLSLPPTIDIPSDPDMMQARWETRFEPRDHPELNTADAARLLNAVDTWPGLELGRARPVVMRAASAGSVLVALLRMEGELADGLPVPIACNGLIVADGNGIERRLDGAGLAQARLRSWNPRL